jgi:hypothetical protein
MSAWRIVAMRVSAPCRRNGSIASAVVWRTMTHKRATGVVKFRIVTRHPSAPQCQPPQNFRWPPFAALWLMSPRSGYPFVTVRAAWQRQSVRSGRQINSLSVS